MKRIKGRHKKRNIQINRERTRFKTRLNQKRRKQIRRRFEQKELARVSSRISHSKDSLTKTKGAPKRKGHMNLVVPSKLNLEKDYDETVGFIGDLKRYALGLRRPVRLVFSELKEISTEALLLLLAELYRCRKIFGDKRITGTYPDNKNIEKIMEASGFFELLNVAQRNPVKTKKYPLEYIKFITGTKLNAGTPLELRDALLGNALKMEVIAKKRLYRAITEAMTNVGHHAYPKNLRKKYKIKNEWWISGHVNVKRNILVILFCDLGVGIPATLPKVHGLEKIYAALSTLPGVQISDAQMIQAGMEIGRTRTGLSGRGKGLNDLRKFVDDTGGGELHIFSRKGHYHYQAGYPEKLHNHSKSVGGTLIKWSVPLENVTDWVANTEERNDEDESN